MRLPKPRGASDNNIFTKKLTNPPVTTISAIIKIIVTFILAITVTRSYNCI